MSLTMTTRHGRSPPPPAARPVPAPRKPKARRRTRRPSSTRSSAMPPPLLLLLLLCVVFSRAACGATATAMRSVRRMQTLTIRHHIEGTSPRTVYDACLCGWRDANFHLPIPHPLTLDRGDEVSGLRFRLMRVPPFLIERCVDVSYPHSMEYGVANPGLLTYPVSHHRGRITFEEYHHHRDDGSGVGTVFTWHVEWIPLRGCGWFVSPLTRWVVEAAAAFTIAESERRRDGKSRYWKKAA